MKRKVFSLLVSLVFIGNSYSSIFLNKVVDDDSHSCHDWADSVSKRVGFMQGWTYQQQHQAYLHLYDECVESQNNTLQQAP